jgi:dolichol-phosphate mannosyltransferase
MATEPRTLIFIPTYNERDNAPKMCEQIFALGLDADVLFVDDNSPDGTGELLEALRSRFPRLIVQHREGKLGIGSAHADAIQWAYDQGYTRLATMDCDFTHSPSDMPAMIEAARDHDVAVGSRWAKENSLQGWNVFRRGMTWLGHFLTKNVLGISQDASGAFRAYRLDRIPRELFTLVKSRGYSFFFESLFILDKNCFSIREISIVLPARTYGHSKMTISAAWRSLQYLFELAVANLRRPEQFLLKHAQFDTDIDPSLTDPQGWDTYWASKSNKRGALYELIAGLYRRVIIKRELNRVIRRHFLPASKLLHAGCGSGQVDEDLQHEMKITALDISPAALELYSRNNPRAAAVKHGSILSLPAEDASFDGVYNLGVVEHFSHEKIHQIFTEFYRVLRPGGKGVIFWPHRRATSVVVLKLLHWLLNSVLKKPTKFHPPEISLLGSRSEAEALLRATSFELVDYSFGARDFFVQAVVVGRKLDHR